MSSCLVVFCATALVSGLFAGLGSQNRPAKKITEAEIKTFINSQAGIDVCETLDQIRIEHLEYFDFIGSGTEQAVVVASTCNTGTAGPDIHSVYARDPDGAIVELPFLDAKGDPPPPPTPEPIPVFGNPNYGLTVEHGELVVSWRDSSEREDPVVARYKWDGARFVFDGMDVQGPYPTSYDCARTIREIDRAICYSPSVAALDLQLGKTYQLLVQEIPRTNSEELERHQRSWLAEREKRCVIYKAWVDCLTEMYTKRIAELKQIAPSKH